MSYRMDRRAYAETFGPTVGEIAHSPTNTLMHGI
jgi:urease alpha subunit